MNQLTKITIAWELFAQQMPKTHIAEQLEVNRETVHLWIIGIENNERGLLGFLDDYAKAKKGKRPKRQVDPILKRRVWMIREREQNCCGQKIQYFLNKEYGVKPAVSKIYEILGEKYKLRSRWKKNQLSGLVPHASRPQEVIQMDTIDFGEVFAFTGVDIFSREADVFLAPQLTGHFGHQFLKQSMQRRFHNFVDIIQTDGGPEFKEEFKEHVLEYTKRHRIAHPYKKNEQSYIESFNRTLRKECLGWIKYKPKEIPELTAYVENFLLRYH
ncbi:DDE-type integrase/transposase/recombinase [Patescibacteria group bacterium]|nr:DDE-type integrase/transposase/recombinase [Patescibacteria group bacterium]